MLSLEKKTSKLAGYPPDDGNTFWPNEKNKSKQDLYLIICTHMVYILAYMQKLGTSSKRGKETHFKPITEGSLDIQLRRGDAILHHPGYLNNYKCWNIETWSEYALR